MMARRRLLDILVKLSALAVSGVFGLPALLALVLPSFRKPATVRVRLGPLSQFSATRPVAVSVSYQKRDGWVIRSFRRTVFVSFIAPGQFKVLSNICTHASCAITWDGQKNGFFCPCHDGLFGKDGRVLAGPPTRPLEEFPVQIEGGYLFVELPA